MKKIIFVLLFLGVSASSLFSDRFTAQENAVTAAIELENRGYTIREIPGRYLSQGHYRTYNRYLYGGNCYAIVGVGDQHVRDLDVIIYDRYWNVVASDTDSSSVSAAKICLRHSGTYRIRTKMYSGNGYFYQVIAWR